MEQILSIIWFVGLIGGFTLTMIAVMWAAENRDNAHLKVMNSNSVEEIFLYKKEWEKWARTTMCLFGDAIYGTDEAVNGCVCALCFKDGMWDIDDGGWLYERMFFKVVVDSR